MLSIRLPAMTMSTGPRGGAPLPSIIVAPRMTQPAKGPSPSPGWRSGTRSIRAPSCATAPDATASAASAAAVHNPASFIASPFFAPSLSGLKHARLFCHSHFVARTILLYAAALAAAALALNWLEYRFLARAFSTEIYIALLCVGFVALGIWAGVKLTPRHAPPAAFERNHAAIRSLGLSPREV